MTKINVNNEYTFLLLLITEFTIRKKLPIFSLSELEKELYSFYINEDYQALFLGIGSKMDEQKILCINLAKGYKSALDMGLLTQLLDKKFLIHLKIEEALEYQRCFEENAVSLMQDLCDEYFSLGKDYDWKKHHLIRTCKHKLSNSK